MPISVQTGRLPPFDDVEQFLNTVHTGTRYSSGRETENEEDYRGVGTNADGRNRITGRGANHNRDGCGRQANGRGTRRHRVVQGHTVRRAAGRRLALESAATLESVERD